MHEPTPFQRAVPNALTIARFVLMVVFVALLALYDHPGGRLWALPTATALFVIAAVTDALDGYLARRWNAISIFGRIMDPLADKLLVLGAFVMLAGPSFVDESGRIASGVHAWMVVIILARELLVTTMRAVLESRGVDFSASTTGKLKMIAQSVGAPVIMVLVWYGATQPSDETAATGWLTWAPFAVALAVTIVTALSALPYLTRAISALRVETP